jgi:hypothetical protein
MGQLFDNISVGDKVVLGIAGRGAECYSVQVVAKVTKSTITLERGDTFDRTGWTREKWGTKSIVPWTTEIQSQIDFERDVSKVCYYLNEKTDRNKVKGMSTEDRLQLLQMLRSLRVEAK